MKIRSLMVAFLITLGGSFLIWFFCFRISREEKLKERGNNIVVRIERFRTDFGRLPNSLEEIGLKEEVSADALYYQKRDTSIYILSFGTALGESMIYYSDGKTWEEINRK
jgi:hypothetical protein